eukprot:scpid51837/ scgid17716/ PHD finger protein 21A; BHC80a; BRAF35-HDAC complex protein BHC80
MTRKFFEVTVTCPDYYSLENLKFNFSETFSDDYHVITGMSHDQSIMAVSHRNPHFCGGVMRPLNGSMDGPPPPLLAASAMAKQHSGDVSSTKYLMMSDDKVVRNGLGATTMGAYAPAPVVSSLVGQQRGHAAAPGHIAEARPVTKSLQDSVPSLMDSQRQPGKLDPVDLAPAVPPPCSREKEEFMASLGLITIPVYKEIKARRQTRKRRKAAPYSIDLAEQEAKRMREMKDARANAKGKSNGRNFPPLAPTPLGKNAMAKPAGPSPFVQERDPSLQLNVKTTVDTGVQTEGGLARKRKRQLLFVCSEDHDGLCEICDQAGELLLCDTCTKAYHFTCLVPNLPTMPQGMWICPKCQDEAANTEVRAWPGTISLVRAFTQYDDDREGQRRALEQELQRKRQERAQLHQSLAALTQTVSTRVRKQTAYTPGTDMTLYYRTTAVKNLLEKASPAHPDTLLQDQAEKASM